MSATFLELRRNPWANLRPIKDPPIQPGCAHTPVCLPFMVAPSCDRCGGELTSPCKAPTEGDTRECFMRCGGRFTFSAGAWFHVGELPEQWEPERVRPTHLRRVA